nr:methyltransferase domain-containing protein [Bacteroidota bacterium]
MKIEDVHKLYSVEMTDHDFSRLSKFIFEEYGIKMPPQKKLLLQGRLRSRLRERNIGSFKEYIDFLFSNQGQQIELVHMIDVVTTNKTDFFREPDHFDFLFNEILEEFQSKSSFGRNFKIWSAGCASGEEPYTMAIILSEFKALHHAFDFSITASDISSRALEQAQTAIYPEEKVVVIPLSLKKIYLLKSKDQNKKNVRIVSSLRSRIKFIRHNLMDIQSFDESGFDTIFCRNTLIYFDRKTQLQVLSNLINKLKHGGYLLIGHSESILNETFLPVKRVRPTIYKKI